MEQIKDMQCSIFHSDGGMGVGKELVARHFMILLHEEEPFGDQLLKLFLRNI